MQNLLTRHYEKNIFPEHNFFGEYYKFGLELEEQIKAIDNVAKFVGETNPLVILLHKHIIAVTAMLEGQAMISSDDHRPYLDEPAKFLNQTMRELYEMLQKER